MRQFIFNMDEVEEALMNFLMEHQAEMLLGDAVKEWRKQHPLTEKEEVDFALRLFGRIGLLEVDYGGHDPENPAYRMLRWPGEGL